MTIAQSAAARDLPPVARYAAGRWARGDRSLERAAVRLLAIASSIPALIVLAFLLDVRRLVAWAEQANCPTLLESFGKIDFLTLAEWVFILALVARSDFSMITAGRIERFASAALALCAIAFVDPFSHVHILPCVWLASRLAVARRLWPLCACLLLVSLQRGPDNVFPDALHATSIFIDAWAAHFVLSIAGYANEIHGAVLRLAGSSHAIDIHAGCDTLYESPMVVTAFLIFSLARNLRFDRRFAAYLGVVLVLLFVANWLRLCAMALSYDNYLYWHFGSGASIAAMVYALIPFLLNDALAKGQKNEALGADAERVAAF
jgi:hypothetical protein